MKRLVLIAFFLHLAYLIALIWINPPITITMLSNRINGFDISYKPISSKKQGKTIKLAALASEDQKFLTHFGLDFMAIQSALNNNRKGKSIRGGSTISQQTAKNVFLWQGRDWIRKGLEAYSTLLIEVIWGKERILEHYLNVAEMGEGIYGVQAAAQFYYKVDANRLSMNQAALIIASLPNPKKMNPNKKTKTLLRKHSWIVKQMKLLAKNKSVQELVSDRK